jgi:hypothetical protein
MATNRLARRNLRRHFFETQAFIGGEMKEV